MAVRLGRVSDGLSDWTVGISLIRWQSPTASNVENKDFLPRNCVINLF